MTAVSARTDHPLAIARAIESAAASARTLRVRLKHGPWRRTRRRARRQLRKLRVLLDELLTRQLSGSGLADAQLAKRVGRVQALLDAALTEPPSKEHLQRLRKLAKRHRHALSAWLA